MIGATSQGRFNFKGATSNKEIDSTPSEDKTFVIDIEGGDGSQVKKKYADSPEA